MTKKQIPIVAAIPNFNMSKGLDRLLPKLLNQGYSAIYVLDDASTDDSFETVKKYPTVIWIGRDTNGGAGAARNLILTQLHENTIIHFMDADVIPIGSNFGEKINKLDFNESVGYISGLTLYKDGQQSPWNFGPKLSLLSSFMAFWYNLLQPAKSTIFGKRVLKLFRNRPSGVSNQNESHPYWAPEANLFIASDHLRKYGPFDENIREHDIQPISARIYKAGIKNGFTDSVVVTAYFDIKVRHYNRLLRLFYSEFYIVKHYIGWKNWIFGRKKWD